MINRGNRRWALLVLVPMLLVAAQAQAITRTSLAEGDLKAAYGSYARGGDCSQEPRLTIDASGFTFQALGRTVKPARFDHAVSFLGPEYAGISSVFFPFPVNEDNLGPVTMIINDGEKPGLVRIEADVRPGQRLDAFYAAFTGASPLRRCTAPGRPAAAAAPAPVAGARGTPWQALPVAGRAPIATVDAAASPSITSFSLFCEGKQPVIAMLFNKPSSDRSIMLSWTFAGGSIDMPMRQGNREATFWQAALAGTRLLPMLMSQRGSAMLRLNGRPEGEVSLANAPAVLRATMRDCAMP
jgi:hypothetical protein